MLLTQKQLHLLKITMEIVVFIIKGNEQKKLVEKIVRQVVVITISDEKEKLLLDMIDEVL